MKSKKLQEKLDKLKKILPRKKIAPPTKIHKSAKEKKLKDYSREIDPRDLT